MTIRVDLDPLSSGLLAYIKRRTGLSQNEILQRLLCACAAERLGRDVLPYVPLVPEAVQRCAGWVAQERASA